MINTKDLNVCYDITINLKKEHKLFFDAKNTDFNEDNQLNVN